MSNAARAVIFNSADNSILVMKRDKQGLVYYTLVGGRIEPHETPEQAVAREVYEETGLTVTGQQLVFIEKYPEPYTSQYTFLCTVADPKPVGVLIGTEEEIMNRDGMNTHKPYWITPEKFAKLPFRTPALQKHITIALKKGFLNTPTEI